ncbi:non-canonical purine NTP pyrophosphatase [Gaiella sp.]|uniref:non-canonical purine NTP pyrophosphatase n=1 Tax=Gaiella sp. TaxID=2663207 RepID=UPI003266F5CD
MRARLATGNRHKLDEFRRALPDWEIELVETTSYPPETGSTYVANARGKAEHGRLHSPGDAWVVGEDSGIEAMGLKGGPGLESARWAADGVARLLEELDGVGDRRARYVCTIVAIGPEGQEVVVEGTLEGAVVSERSGNEGFGYDPIFVPEGETHTVADLGDAWKASNSHRARATRALAAALQRSGSSRGGR